MLFVGFVCGLFDSAHVSSSLRSFLRSGGCFRLFGLLLSLVICSVVVVVSVVCWFCLRFV